MDTKLLFRVHRKSTDSWLSLVVPDELSSKEQKAIWLADMCGDHFQPKDLAHVPIDILDQYLIDLTMREGENDGQNFDDSRRGNGSEN
tara:strand:- start:10 stop:273 length:264 start_codon:yes stop_codon:yes gene_type:complete